MSGKNDLCVWHRLILESFTELVQTDLYEICKINIHLYRSNVILITSTLDKAMSDIYTCTFPPANIQRINDSKALSHTTYCICKA